MAKQLRLDVAQLTDVGRKREHNEDNMAYVIPKDLEVMTKKGALFIVADGMGGHTAGEVASEIAVDTVSNVYYQDDSDDVAISLLRAIKRANAAIYQRAAENILQPGMGTTCVAAVLRGNMAYIANVGDSRAYLLHGNQIKQISQDHSWVAEQMRAGLLTEDQARTHAQQNVITRCLGTQAEVDIDVFQEELNDSDSFVLCTDGLSGLVSDEELRRIVEQYPPQESVYHLVERANENGGPDNITAIVMRIHEVGVEPPSVRHPVRVGENPRNTVPQVDNLPGNASNAAPQVVNHGEQTEQIEIAIRALADTPSDIDLLQFSDFADALVDFIKSEKTQKPLTIAIDAAWGMGKTTLMRMIQRRLEGKADNEKQESPSTRVESKQKDQNATTKPTFPIVWFNAWQYDQEDSLWAALVLEILEQVGKQFTLIQRAGFRWNLTQKRLGKRNLFIQIVFRLLPFIVGLIVLLAILFVVAWLWQGNTFIETIKKIFLPIAGILGVATLTYTGVKDVYTRFIKPLDQRIAQYISEPHYKDRIGFLARFKEDFSSIVEAATSEGKWPLIIFIDDLDRCAPPKPVEIIEAINLLLDAQYCVFVMGMDTRTVAGSIEAKYKDLLTYLGATDFPGELTLGQRFLEKIIQITFHLPRADTLVVQSFIDTILTRTEENIETPPPSKDVLEAEQLIEAEQRGGKSLDAAAETVRQARSDILDSALVKAKEEIRVRSFDDSQVVQDVIRQVAPFLELNPRKIKRFINLFRLQALIANRRGLLEAGAIKLDVLAKWIVISSRWPSVVDALLADEHFIDHLKKAHEVRETIRRERQNIGPENEQKLQSYDEKFYQAKLETYTINPHVKLLVDATDLMNLLNQLTDVDIQALPIYLHLTQIASQTG